VLPRPALPDDKDVVAVRHVRGGVHCPQVMRQFGHYQEWPVPVVRTVPSAHHR
jgi:hypothetical protein